MGSSPHPPSGPPQSENGPAPKYPAPELLARLVVRCRELETFLQMAAGHLPRPDASPFLFRQLEGVVGRLQRGLLELGLESDAPEEDERGGFMRLFSSKKRKGPAQAHPMPTTIAKTRYDLQGSAWTIPVTELVGFLSQSGKSGVLWVTTSSETFVLEFTRGSLVHATSNAPPRAFRLGEILIREEKIDRQSLDREIERARSSEEFLGSHLVRAGLITKHGLQRALAVQVQELFHRLMDAENATYGFQDGLQLLRAQSLEVNITQLLLESARKKDETRHLAQGKAPPPPLSILDGLSEPVMRTPEPPAARAEAEQASPDQSDQAGAQGDGEEAEASPAEPNDAEAPEPVVEAAEQAKPADMEAVAEANAAAEPDEPKAALPAPREPVAKSATEVVEPKLGPA